MKNGLLVLNIVLLILVGVLFYWHFSSKEKVAAINSRGTDSSSGQHNHFSIAYFDMDSINNSFAMIKDVKNELSKREQSYTTDLSRLEKSIYDKANEYQSQASTMSQVQSEQATNDINQRRKNYENQKARYEQEFQDFNFRKTQEVKGMIENFLKDYNKDKGYTYIFSYEPGFIYYKDTMYNITGDVLRGLNDIYSKKK
jgi:outer membrane protein